EFAWITTPNNTTTFALFHSAEPVRDSSLRVIAASVASFGTLVADITTAVWAGITTAASNFIGDHVLRRKQTNIEAAVGPDAIDLHSLYGAIQQLQKSAVSGATLTVKKTDGTTLGTLTLTSSASADPITSVT